MFQLPQLGQHAENDVGQIKGDMRQKHRAVAQADAGKEKEHHQRNTRYDIWAQHGDIRNGLHGLLALFLHAINADGRQRTDDGGAQRLSLIHI